MDMIWELSSGPVTTDRVARALVIGIEGIVGFEPDRYDLNQRGAYRAYDREHVVVDLLTQRTQILRIEGKTPGAFAAIATGKHGEQPVMMMRWSPVEEDPRVLTSSWAELFANLPLSRAVLTSQDWLAGPGPSKGVPGFVLAYPHERCAGLESALTELSRAGAISLDSHPFYMRVILTPEADLDGLGAVFHRL